MLIPGGGRSYLDSDTMKKIYITAICGEEAKIAQDRKKYIRGQV